MGQNCNHMRLDSTTVLQNTSQTMKKIENTRDSGKWILAFHLWHHHNSKNITYLFIYLFIYLCIYLFVFIYLFIYSFIIYIYILRFRLKRWSSSPRDPRLLT